MNKETVSAVSAIDVHGHNGDYTDGKSKLGDDCMSATGAQVAEKAMQCNIKLSIVSPLLGLMPRFCADTAVGNDEAAKVVPTTPRLLQWLSSIRCSPKLTIKLM